MHPRDPGQQGKSLLGERRLVDRHGRPFLIRVAGPGDARAIGEILINLARVDEYILLSPWEVGADAGKRSRELELARNSGTRWHVAVAEQDGLVVGMLDLRGQHLAKCFHVVELGVGLLPQYTDRGIGTALIEYAMDWAGHAGYSKMRLFVIESNARARHVYERMGFVRTGAFRREVKVGGGLDDLIVMEIFL